jgi:phage-related protein (TIGR01555 family)
MLNKFGTTQDSSTAYEYQREGIIPDMILTEQYESNGLFAKIIDTPAEEAVKHGISLGLKSPDVEAYIADTLDHLEWENKAATAIKWSRLFGGALGVMLINDGRGIDEPLNWKRVTAIDEIRIYERAIVWPDYSSLYNYDPRDPTRSMTTKFGMPEYYHVNSMYGQFWVHESRCLIFRNGILPEYTMQPYYRFWGIPEYVRIRRELRETITSHANAVKLLERSVQAIYKMQGLAKILSAEGGENEVIKRLQVIDMARNLLNSIAIDAENEDYDFKTAQMASVKDVIDTTCNMLSALTNIPQTILFGRSPAGQNSTGMSDLENYYNYVERMQKLMLRNNLKTLIDIIVRIGLHNGKIEEEPDINLTFNPLWSMSEEEQAKIAHQKAQTQHLKAQTAQLYVDIHALDPHEVRKGLAKEEEFAVEELLTDEDVEDENVYGVTSEDEPGDPANMEKVLDAGAGEPVNGVGVLVVKDGKVLCGKRTDNGQICGPGGHIEDGETPIQAAARETREEFGIKPVDLLPLGQLDNLDEQKYGKPHVYLCTDFVGTPRCKSDEMKVAKWLDPADIEGDLFPPFAASLKLLAEAR